jgi:hypothetical protein
MQIRDINKPVNSKTLNETMAKKYGTKIDVDSFTLEQLKMLETKLDQKYLILKLTKASAEFHKTKPTVRTNSS